ncbi:porin [Paraburkholderia silvatlantica]|uniref:Porin n=1 Tax=Paraburkholderia silvatlantica TaxID=321895 RepID=A0A2U1A650_9BURK|nr:porin [Paraburkholderia silvatlantica]MBB2929222.1 putative porin [Paraburkholderia silvatlantica]PVY27251.1 putative porin [Paraburkholderia silvatlantica]PXW34280.1 putative porin [Paraburkholderia silvatlantica]PYE16169.1 putative porin [Paraburkholderia silvatlantica]TDQ85175.1 putative porin [Paraburkholderia silvatlantica]
MRKTAGLAAAVAVLGGTAATAHAQSSVTLYGIIDEGINYTSNAHGHGTFQMKSGDTLGSRWGLQGTEDLGGGYHAIFRLESGFDVNSGALKQGGRLFGRQSYVGLQSDRAGTLTFGRQYDPTIDLWSGMTGAGGVSGDIASHPFDNDNADFDFRVNNSVKYTSPTIDGFKAEAMYGFSNDTNFANNRLYSAAVQYRMAGLTAALGYLKANSPGSANGAVSTDAVFTGSSEQNIVAAVAYSFSQTKVGFAFSHVDVYDPIANAYIASTATQPPGGRWQSWKFTNYEVNARYAFTPALWLFGAYTFTDAQLHSTVGTYEPKWHQLSLMLNYDLSRRTAVSLQGVYAHVVSAHTGTAFDFPTTPASAGPSTSENQTVVRLAMIHRF